MSDQIPNHLHFVWIGPKLPWFAQLAQQTALRACPDARVTLWSADRLDDDPAVRVLAGSPRFELARLSEDSLFSGADSSLPLDLLARLFRQLKQPAARANVARLMILARHGGIYLDTDTVTFKDLTPLRSLGGFCGLEHVVWPLAKRRGIKSYRVLGGPLRELVRFACSYAPEGEALFARVSGFYETAANNAVLGFTPGHPFLLRMLGLVDRLSEKERARRYRLGTHLLQQSLELWGDELSVRQLAPPFFYPLGPQISHQYFRARGDVAQAAARVITEDTYLVHWYASVSELVHFDEASARAQRDRTLFGRLVAEALG